MTKILKANEFINEQYITEMGMNVRNRNIAGELDGLIKKYNLVYNEVTDRYDCDGDVKVGKDIVNMVNGRLKVKFGVVNGDFNCNSSLLTSLNDAPTKVGGYFECSDNQLTTLEGAPTEVGGGFYCYGNQLTSLKGAPTEVGGDFNCGGNKLTTLEGAPTKVGRDFYCYNNLLTTLKGAPTEVGRDFDCANNKLTTLEGAPTKVGREFDCHGNNFIYDEKHFYGFLPDVIGGDVKFGDGCDYELAKQYYDKLF